MATSQQFCLRWNNHQSTLISVFDHLLESGTLVDCTLAAEGQFLKAHKVVLSACSPYLEALLSQHYEKHPILILKDVTFQELKSMLDYMYRGEVNISQEQLGTFLKAAESLQIKGLTENGAIHENKDLERAREIEHFRELQNVALDRSLGIPILPKRMEGRKHISTVPRARSPLVGLPTNFMNNDQRKSNKSEVNAGSPVNSRNREGSVSPTVKRKRIQNTQVEENKTNQLCKLLENNHVENHIEKKKEPTLPNATNSVPSPNFKADEKKVNNSVSESEKSESAVPVKCEVKTECVDFPDEVQNDDSIGDIKSIDEEEEEMDELDLSRAGPSNSANSTVAGIPWHMVGEGNGEEMLLAQSDTQDPKVDKYRCTLCNKTYQWRQSLTRHIREDRCDKGSQHSCPNCGMNFKHTSRLVKHVPLCSNVIIQMDTIVSGNGVLATRDATTTTT